MIFNNPAFDFNIDMILLFLAVKLQDGSYIFNGNYSISLPGKYQAAGTSFVYVRQSPQNLESFSAIGPLEEPIDVMVNKL